MHDLIQNMGREIVRMKSPLQPGMRSRLWYHKDVLKVLSKNNGSGMIQGMLVDLPNEYTVHLENDPFKKMKNLKFLIIRNAQFFGSRQHLPGSLRLLDWMENPSSSLQSRRIAISTYPPKHPWAWMDKIRTVKCCGIYLYSENMYEVSCMNSDLHGSEEDEDGNAILEVEELSNSITHQTKSKEKGVLAYDSSAHEIVDFKPNKLNLGSSSLPTTIHENEKKTEFLRKGKLKERFNIMQVQASTSTESTSTGKDTVFIESKHNCCDKVERTQIQIPEKSADEEFTQIEDNMEAFYASIEAESSSLPLLQDSMNPRPSEETQNKLQSLEYLISKNFSHLLHSGQSGHLKNVLDYLLSLSAEDGISPRMRSAILQLSNSFSQWSSDYNDASLKLESATATLFKAEKLQESLETNVKKFKEAERSEKAVRSQVDNLEARMRELEQQINGIKAELAEFKLARDGAVQRKRKIFEDGIMIKAEQNDLRNKKPRLIAEQEWARSTQANIESEWSKLVQNIKLPPQLIRAMMEQKWKIQTKQHPASFSQWSSDYNDASLKLESATATLFKAEKLQESLETNVKEFKEAERSENAMCSYMANLEARMRELEQQVNGIKAELADFKLARDGAVQRKRKMFEDGRMIKAEQNDLRIKIPRLRAEQEWARSSQAKIESEWSKLVQQ
ncbi:hypothetical protein L6164_006271 [Bauhinia variegata]|uniref:Uncharacterized protein n=1 Tax=Bauhinia variegata TaxID=167791 RepID=A0ACB9PTE5_BAUVA|nr:hypothetical protein L6164_006271 [Bauhinia variegata]